MENNNNKYIVTLNGKPVFSVKEESNGRANVHCTNMVTHAVKYTLPEARSVVKWIGGGAEIVKLNNYVEQERDALLKQLISYTLNNESKSYEEHVDNGGDPNKHIFSVAQRLSV